MASPPARWCVLDPRTPIGTSISRRRLAGVDRVLSFESPLVRGPGLAAGHISRQVRVLVQQARRSRPEEHRHHEEVAGAERAIEPGGITQAAGKLVEAAAYAIFYQRKALRGPRLVGLVHDGGLELEDR